MIGTLSDYPGDSSRKYRQVAKQALGAADLVWFVGSNTSHVAKMTAAHTGLHHVRDVRLLCEQLLPDLRPGDLVLAKGSQSDHLERLLLHASGAVACWKSRCGVHYIPCHACAQRLIPSEPDSAPAARAV